ncbi:hypothetical protein MNV49_006672 [Pseudohyphozyma bogoriensis]|nr:hypothetical protein MNV49_006672 [Pseudohyphozyma bogoriensis]
MVSPTLRRWLPEPSAAHVISALKGGLAVTLSVVLVFSQGYDKVAGSKHPVVLAWTCIVAIIGSAGRTVGGCVETVVYGTFGLAYGVFFFYILGLLGEHNSKIGQGFVFAVCCYVAALFRFLGPRYISFYLFAVLFAFYGTYSSIDDPGTPNAEWLLAYFVAHCWGLAIVLAVNIFVWPVSSESELRELLTSSLRHVSTLAHLACKTYTREIEEDEKDVRDHLVASIRSDFSALTARLDEASYEIVLTRWTMSDYRKIIHTVRGLQQALITYASALELIDTLDPEGINVKHHLLAEAETATTFGDFRAGIDKVIADIIDELAGVTVGELEDRAKQPTDIEAQHVPTREPSRQPSVNQVHQHKVNSISARLRLEVERSELRHQRSRSDVEKRSRPPSIIEGAAPVDNLPPIPSREATFSTGPTAADPSAPSTDGLDFFRKSWANFNHAHTEAIIRLIKDGSLQVGDDLRITNGMPSLRQIYSERLPTAWTSSLVSNTNLRRLHAKVSPPAAVIENPLEEDDDTLDGSDEAAPCSEALTKSYSLLFGLGQFTDELCALHQLIANSPRKRRIRFHIFDRKFKWGWKRDPESMTLQEALAALAGGTYKSPPVPLLVRIMKVERWFRSDRSLYALKVALGATIYSLLLLCKVPREFYVNYGMTSSLITVIVAISPSLGQTLATFVLQLTGTGIGSVYGLIILEIFKDVGGYRYNPYGLAVAIFLWMVAISYPFYKYPKYYTGTLLAMNGAGSLVINEWLYNELPGFEADYPSPGLRAGYSIASMCISIVIAAAFQLLIFRVPARRKLRLALASVTYGLSSYNTILQSNINAVAPADKRPPPAPEASQKIQRELMKRETKLQAEIIALGPLFDFAATEPQWITPFKGEALKKIIRSQQIILDRLREGRTAVGMTGFSESIHRDFASQLYPYRLHSQRIARTLFYLGATSLVSKTPLPRDVPSSKTTWASFENDALVLSPKPLKARKSFASLDSFGTGELENLEKHLGELFGIPEETNPNIV